MRPTLVPYLEMKSTDETSNEEFKRLRREINEALLEEMTDEEYDKISSAARGRMVPVSTKDLGAVLGRTFTTLINYENNRGEVPCAIMYLMRHLHRQIVPSKGGDPRPGVLALLDWYERNRDE